MLRKAIGYCLVALPFVLVLGGHAAANGVPAMLGTIAMAGFVVGCIWLGVHLVAEGD